MSVEQHLRNAEVILSSRNPNPEYALQAIRFLLSRPEAKAKELLKKVHPDDVAYVENLITYHNTRHI